MSRKNARSWSMYPNLHRQLSKELLTKNLNFQFYNNDDGRTCIQSYDTNIMGRFACQNTSCPTHGWSSKVIAITIRMYTGNRYNARVYHQRCRQCNTLSRPFLDEETYVERIAYRLKKWRGIDVEQPDYSGESDKPHEEDLCEGCKNGHCRKGRRVMRY